MSTYSGKNMPWHHHGTRAQATWIPLRKRRGRMGRICSAVTIAVALGVAELAWAPASMAASSGLVAAYWV